MVRRRGPGRGGERCDALDRSYTGLRGDLQSTRTRRRPRAAGGPDGEGLAWQGNPNLKLGNVEQKDDDTIVAEIVLGILASMIVARFSRWREYRADAAGGNAVELGEAAVEEPRRALDQALLWRVGRRSAGGAVVERCSFSNA